LAMPIKVHFQVPSKVGTEFHRGIIVGNNGFYWRLFHVKWH
jgi:hypothetical protein